MPLDPGLVLETTRKGGGYCTRSDPYNGFDKETWESSGSTLGFRGWHPPLCWPPPYFGRPKHVVKRRSREERLTEDDFRLLDSAYGGSTLTRIGESSYRRMEWFYVPWDTFSIEECTYVLHWKNGMVSEVSKGRLRSSLRRRDTLRRNKELDSWNSGMYGT